MRYLVFSDLDGTFLDHHTYRYDAALPVLCALTERDIPCIWNTSKTFAEVSAFRHALAADRPWTATSMQRLQAPFIIENGAAVFLPLAEFANCANLVQEENFLTRPFSPTLPRILDTLRELAPHYRFKGFSTMSLAEVVACTGLDRESALLARQRVYTEPLVWLDGPARLADFVAELEELGLRCRRGGRFLHVSGEHDKGTAMRWLRDIYSQRWGTAVTCIALGDGQNDLPMLEAADIAVVMPAADGSHLRLDANLHLANTPVAEPQFDGGRQSGGRHPGGRHTSVTTTAPGQAHDPTPTARILRPRQAGPEGWAKALDALLGPF